MMSFLRSQSQTVLVIILVVIGGSFLFYGNVGSLLTSSGGRANTDFGRIDGEDLSVAELFDAVRNTRDSLVIQGQGQSLNQPGAKEQVAQEAWRRLLLLHEADRLHIVVSDKELVDFIQSRPIFQKNGVYSPEVYQSQMTLMQNAFHITPDAFEKIMRDNLRADAASNALFSTIRNSARDVSEEYEKYYGPTAVSCVSIDPKAYLATAQVSPQEIEAEYKAHPENSAYRTPEKRRVDYVLLPLSPDQARLPAKEKAAAMEALGQRALNFALALQPEPTANPSGAQPPPDFMTEAKKEGLSPLTTDFFTTDTPPANVPPSPTFNTTAFALSKENSVSKVIELPDAVAVLHLAEIQPSDLRPLDEVKADIARQLQQAQAAQAAQIAADIAAQALQAEVAKGTDFKTAAAAQKLQVETMPPFVPAKVSQTDARLQTIAYVASTLDTGKVSKPVPMQSDNSILIVHVDSRTQADPAGFAEFETRFRQSRDEQLRMLAYIDWANWMSKQPGTHKPPQLEQYGSIE